MIAELGVGAVNRHGSRRAQDHGPLFGHDVIAAARGRRALAAAAAFAREAGLI